MAEDNDVTRRGSAGFGSDLDDEMDETGSERMSPRHRVENLLENVSSSEAVRMVKDNPVPVALIGAGIGWLIIDALTSNGRDYRTMDDYEEDPWQSGSDRTWSYDDVDELSESEGRGDGAASKVRRAASTVKDRVSDLTDRARGTITSGHDYDEGGESSGRLRRVAEHTQQAQLGFWQAMERSPLGVGAIAFALGVAGGLAIPTTRWEDETMGVASETIKREAKGAARDISETARRVAKDAARAAGRDARNLGGTGTITERAKHVVQSAREAAVEAAQREDLTGSVRDRAKGVISQIRDTTGRDSETK